MNRESIKHGLWKHVACATWVTQPLILWWIGFGAEAHFRDLGMKTGWLTRAFLVSSRITRFLVLDWPLRLFDERAPPFPPPDSVRFVTPSELSGGQAALLCALVWTPFLAAGACLYRLWPRAVWILSATGAGLAACVFGLMEWRGMVPQFSIIVAVEWYMCVALGAMFASKQIARSFRWTVMLAVVGTVLVAIELYAVLWPAIDIQAHLNPSRS